MNTHKYLKMHESNSPSMIGTTPVSIAQYFKLFGHIIMRIAHIVIWATASAAIAGSEPTPVEYTDNEYGYAFQFPADWKLQKLPHPGEAGEIRVVVQSPGGNCVAVTVGKLDKTLSKRAFQSNPKSAQVVDAMIDLTIEQVYKKMSREVGATRMMVVDRQMLQSDLGVQFYINTAHFVRDKLLVGVTGIHAIPFEKSHTIAFVMTVLVDPKAKQENETLTRVFQSFHLVGEKPLSGR